MRATVITTIGRILLLSLAVACSSCSSRKSGTSDNIAIESDAQKNGRRILRVYSALDPNETKIYFSEYEKETGVKTQWIRMSSGAILTRLDLEKGSPAMSLWFGGPSIDFISASEKGLLEPYKPNIDFEIPEIAHDRQWRWTGFYFGAIGFASNMERLKKIGADPPRSWNDLLKPEFRGEIGMAYPYTSGTSYTILSTIIKMKGVKNGFEYVRALDKNIHSYNKSGSSCVTQAGLGEIAVGIAFSHDILKKGSAAGYPVQLTFPQDGTGYEVGGIAVVKNAPDREEAQKFIDWALSTRGQNLMKSSFRIPLNPSAEVAPGAVTADRVRLVEEDPLTASKNKNALIEQWRLVTSR